MRPPFVCKSLVLAIAVIGFSPVISLSLQAQSVSQEQVEIIPLTVDIAEGPLSNAINELARLAGEALSYEASLTTGKMTKGIKGTYGLEQALNQLLAGTGLTSRRQGSGGGYVIVVIDSGEGVMILDPVQVSSSVLGSNSEGTGSYTTGLISIGKTRESLRDTPQSVSVVTRERLDDQNISSLPEVMKNVTGITVTKYDGAGYFNEFNARGYSADTFQLDGLNVQIDGNMADTDLAIMDRVEVQRGAAGLFQGSGEPGVTVNLARKRALEKTQIHGLFSTGSWSSRRVEMDMTGALTDDSKLRGRVVAVLDDRDSYLDGVHGNKNVAYGTIEYDVLATTTLSMGVTWQKIDSVIDQGLPTALDGSLVDFPRSTAIVPAWNELDMETLDIFAEIEHALANQGQLKFIVRQMKRERLYNGSRVNSYIEDDGTIDVSNEYSPSEFQDISVDLFLQKPFQSFGREHEVIIGADYRSSDNLSKWGVLRYDTYISQANIYEFNENSQEPSLVSGGAPNRTEIRQQGLYTRFKYNATDVMKFLFGARLSWWDSRRENVVTGEVSSKYDVKQELTPYVAALYDLDDNFSLYASYTDIFKPQNAITRNGKQIDPRTGQQIEIGLKADFFDGQVNSHAAIFRIEDKNRALRDPIDDQFSIASGEVRSEGFEMETSGEIFPNWQLTAGYAYNRAKYITATEAEEGESFSTITPKHNINIWTKYYFDSSVLQSASVGGGVRKVSEFYSYYGDTSTIAPGYTVFSLQGAYPINKDFQVAVNVDNVFDKKYYEKVENWYRQNFYGSPRTFTFTLRGSF